MSDERQRRGLSVRHHYVPKFLLRPWLVGDRNPHLVGYWWNYHASELARKTSGLNGFGHQPHLLRLSSDKLAPDALEQQYFGVIDDRGAKVRDKIVNKQRPLLNADERSDFARFLLSLDARRPENVRKLRAGAEHLRTGLDNDAKVVQAIHSEGFDMLPSCFIEEVLGHPLEDRALLGIQQVVGNRRIGQILLIMHWQVKHLGERDGTLILSDRPLIRIGGIDEPKTIWALPLSPQCAFIACASRGAASKIERATGNRFRKLLNVNSASQADRYAFTINDADAAWLGKYLQRPADPGENATGGSELHHP